MKRLVLLLSIFVCISVHADVHFVVVSPPTRDGNLKSKLAPLIQRNYKLLFTGTSVFKLKNDLNQLVSRSKYQDTIIMYWAGHTGYDNQRIPCFILSNNLGKDPNIQKDEIISFVSIRDMVDWFITSYKYRIIMVLDTCFAGNYQFFHHYNDKSTIILATGVDQPNFTISELGGGWFTHLFLLSLKKSRNSEQIVKQINKGYQDRKYYDHGTLEPGREKQPLPKTYYPLIASHLGNAFNF